MLLDNIPKPVQIEVPRKCKLFGLFDKKNEIVCSCDLCSYARMSINYDKEFVIRLWPKEKIFEFVKFLENEFEIHSHYKLEIWSDIQFVDTSVYLAMFESYNKFFNLGLQKEDYLKYFPNSYTNLFGGIYYHNKYTDTYNLISKNEFLFVFCNIGEIFTDRSFDIDIDYKSIISYLQREDTKNLIRIMNEISNEIIENGYVSEEFARAFEILTKKNVGVKPVIIEGREMLAIYCDGQNINEIKKSLNDRIFYESFVGVDGMKEFSIF